MSQGLFSTPIRSGIIISWLDPSTTWIQNWNYFEIVHRYDSEVSRRSTLLTKFNITLHWLFILWIPAQVLDTLRFAIGSTFPTALCRAYVYYRWQLKWLFEIRLTTLRGVLQFFKMSSEKKLMWPNYVLGFLSRESSLSLSVRMLCSTTDSSHSGTSLLFLLGHLKEKIPSFSFNFKRALVARNHLLYRSDLHTFCQALLTRLFLCRRINTKKTY